MNVSHYTGPEYGPPDRRTTELLTKATHKLALGQELIAAVQEYFRLKKRYRRCHKYEGEVQLEQAWKAYEDA